MRTQTATLVLHSSCISRDDSVDAATSNTTANRSVDNEDSIATLRQSTLTCDFIVLPEFPQHSSTEGFDMGAQQFQEDLYPCGTDNVFLLRDLQPAAKDYLLSIHDCSIVLGDVVLPVQAIPSTLSFPLEFDPRTNAAVSELEVTFDMAMARRQLAEWMYAQQQKEVEMPTQSLPQTTTSRDQETMPLLSGNLLADKLSSLLGEDRLAEAIVSRLTETSSCLNSPDTVASPHDNTHIRQQLQALAEKELEDLNRIFAGLVGAAILVFMIFLWAVSPLLRGRISLKRNESTASTPQDVSDEAINSLWERDCSKSTTSRFQDENIIPETHDKAFQNVESSVQLDMISLSPISMDPTIDKTSKSPACRIDTDSGGQMSSETRVLSEESSQPKPARLFELSDSDPNSAGFPSNLKDPATSDKRDSLKPSVESTVKVQVTSAPPKDRPEQIRDLSPLSRMEQHWERTKEVRKNIRKVRKIERREPIRPVVITPVAPSEKKFVADHAGGCTPLVSPDNIDEDATAQEPDLCESSMSEDNFIQDYWGG